MQQSLDALELASKLPWGTALTGRMVAAAIHAIGFGRAEELAPTLPARAVPAALARVRQVRQEWPSMSETWESERIAHLTLAESEFRKMQRESLLQQLQSLQSVQLEPSLPETLRLAVTPRRTAMLNADRFLKELIAESKKPFGERREPTPPADAWAQNGLNVFAGRRTEFILEWPVTQLAMLELYLAARLHRLRHGRWPARLDQIDPDVLPQAPRDLWGRKIGYRLKGSVPLVYSLGADGKDDGGAATAPSFEAASTGDLVFGRLSRRR
jgi:hypothetical protein